MVTIGDNNCSAAVFIYKSDTTIADALQKAQSVAAEHYSKSEYTEKQKSVIVEALGYDPTDSSGRFVYQVHAEDKKEFLDELKAWAKRVSNESPTLLIYAHSGQLGINRADGDDAHRITWAELATALPTGVESLWIAGCKSKYCLDSWAETGGPAKCLMVCTASSEPWAKLIPSFKLQISFDPTYTISDITQRLDLDFGRNVELLERENGVWAPVAVSSQKASDKQDEGPA